MPAADCSEVLKAMADQTRQRIVKSLLVREWSVNELAEKLSLPQYSTSKHLSVLRSAGIVAARALGSRREYRIAPALRRKLERDGTLDFGCCTFRIDLLAK